jgi:hypothetical protein
LAIILFKKAIAFSWPIISSSNVRLMGTLVSVVFMHLSSLFRQILLDFTPLNKCSKSDLSFWRTYLTG